MFDKNADQLQYDAFPYNTWKCLAYKIMEYNDNNKIYFTLP